MSQREGSSGETEGELVSTFQESLRCHVCCEEGKMRYQYGSYCCDKCDQCWRADHAGQFLEAFEKGRKWERENPSPNNRTKPRV